MTGTVREYLYAGGEAPTAMRARQSDGTYANYFFVTNTHGDVVALTDKDGVIVNRYAYGPWGEATRVSEQVHQPFRYAGYRHEDGFDLYYLRARWYDSGTGRFVSRDGWRGTFRSLKSTNRYTYALCAPSTIFDPSGTTPQCYGGHADLPSAYAAEVTHHLITTGRVFALQFGVPLELVLDVIYHENDFDPPANKSRSKVLAMHNIWKAGGRYVSVGPMNVTKPMLDKLGVDARLAWASDGTNIYVGSAFLKYRMNQGQGLGDHRFYDEWLTLVYRGYVANAEEDQPWAIREIFGDEHIPAGQLDPMVPEENRSRRFIDFCARLETFRGIAP